MQKTTLQNPYELLEQWASAKDTLEHKVLGSQSTTTEEKERIRKERLDIFLPKMEKEYKEFKIKKIYDDFQDFFDEWVYSGGQRVIAALVTYFVLAFIFLYLLQALNIPEAILREIKSTILKITFIIGVIVGVLGYRIPKIIMYIINLIRGKSKKDIVEGFAYTEAFLMANGFYYQKPYARYGAQEITTITKLLIPKKIKQLNFSDFVEYIRVNQNPEFTTYQNEATIFRSIFYYVSESELNLNKKSRKKLANILKKHQEEAKRLEEYYKRRIANNWESTQTYNNNQFNQYRQPIQSIGHQNSTALQNKRTYSSSNNNINNNHNIINAKFTKKDVKMRALKLRNNDFTIAALIALNEEISTNTYKINNNNLKSFMDVIATGNIRRYGQDISDGELELLARALINRESGITNRLSNHIYANIADAVLNKEYHKLQGIHNEEFRVLGEALCIRFN